MSSENSCKAPFSLRGTPDVGKHLKTVDEIIQQSDIADRWYPTGGIDPTLAVRLSSDCTLLQTIIAKAVFDWISHGTRCQLFVPVILCHPRRIHI